MRFLVVVAVSESRIRVNAIHGSGHSVVVVAVVVAVEAVVVVVVAVVVVAVVAIVLVVVCVVVVELVRQCSGIVILVFRVPCNWGMGCLMVCLVPVGNHANSLHEINGGKPSELLILLSHNLRGKLYILCQFPNILYMALVPYLSFHTCLFPFGTTFGLLCVAWLLPVFHVFRQENPKVVWLAVEW